MRGMSVRMYLCNVSALCYARMLVMYICMFCYVCTYVGYVFMYVVYVMLVTNVCMYVCKVFLYVSTLVMCGIPVYSVCMYDVHVDAADLYRSVVVPAAVGPCPSIHQERCCQHYTLLMHSWATCFRPSG